MKYVENEWRNEKKAPSELDTFRNWRTKNKKEWQIVRARPSLEYPAPFPFLF